MVKGVDADISGATIFIRGKIELGKVKGEPLVHHHFSSLKYL